MGVQIKSEHAQKRSILPHWIITGNIVEEVAFCETRRGYKVVEQSIGIICDQKVAHSIIFGTYIYMGVEEDKVGEVGQNQILEGLELKVKKFGFYSVDDENPCILFFCRRIP